MKILLFILLNIHILFAVNIQEIQKGDVIEDNVQRLEKKYYKVAIENLKNIHVTLKDLSDDVDLYLQTEHLTKENYNDPVEQRLPTIRNNSCYSSNGHTEEEDCSYLVVGPAPGAYPNNVYIMVYGFKAASYKLKVQEEEREIIPTLTEEPINSSVEKKESKHYKIYGKAGETISATLFNLTDDADLRLKIGRKAGIHVFDCKSTNGGTKKDECSVTLSKNDTVYIQVYGYKDAKYSIKGSHIVDNEDDKLIKKVTDFCLNNQGGTENTSETEIICAEIHRNPNGAYVLDKNNNKILYIKNEQILQQKIVEPGNKPSRIINNNDDETSTIAYYNGLTYSFYVFLNLNEVKEVLKYKIPNHAEVTKVYIAQKNSDIWQIYLEYTDKESGKRYRDVYYSNDFSHNYLFESHTEI